MNDGTASATPTDSAHEGWLPFRASDLYHTSIDIEDRTASRTWNSVLRVHGPRQRATAQGAAHLRTWDTCLALCMHSEITQVFYLRVSMRPYVLLGWCGAARVAPEYAVARAHSISKYGCDRNYGLTLGWQSNSQELVNATPRSRAPLISTEEPTRAGTTWSLRTRVCNSHLVL